MPDQEGYRRKYIIERVDGKPLGRTITIEIDKDPQAVEILQQLALIYRRTRPLFASDLARMMREKLDGKIISRKSQASLGEPSPGENNMTIESIAIICHQANKALCQTQGDDSQLDWPDAPQWQRDSAIAGVEFNLQNPDAPASASHESWLAQKEKEGWVYGPAKNPEAKEHPCMVPYGELPDSQKAKDHLFKGIVASLSAFVTDTRIV